MGGIGACIGVRTASYLAVLPVHWRLLRCGLTHESATGVESLGHLFLEAALIGTPGHRGVLLLRRVAM
jgi:hypothetical protein